MHPQVMKEGIDENHPWVTDDGEGVFLELLQQVLCANSRLLALRRCLRSFIVNTYILVLSLSLCMFMLHDCLILIMETNFFSLPIEELIDSQQIRMKWFVLVISRKGKRRVILFILLGKQQVHGFS